MDRLILSLSGLLFIITWTFLIILIVQPDEKVYAVKFQSISEEIVLSEKESSSLYALASRELDTSTKAKQEETDPMTKLSDVIKFNNGQGVSIDTLLELFNLNEEATPNS